MNNDNSVNSSWADEIENDSGALPPPNDVIENSYRYVTEYKYNKDHQKVKVMRTFKISKEVVPKTVAQRRTWVKFGESKDDKPGPSSHTTKVSDEMFIQFINRKDEEKLIETSNDTSKCMAKCRICNGEHWSVNCPYKGTAMEANLLENKVTVVAPIAGSSKSSKYVPPFLKELQKSKDGSRNRDDPTAIRISNLSESMTEADLEELVRKIGPHNKMYLARDKNTGLCKGFAYVHFKQQKDAAAAIEILNGHGYDHLIINVDWSKPQQN